MYLHQQFNTALQWWNGSTLVLRRRAAANSKPVYALVGAGGSNPKGGNFYRLSFEADFQSQTFLELAIAIELEQKL